MKRIYLILILCLVIASPVLADEIVKGRVTTITTGTITANQVFTDSDLNKIYTITSSSIIQMPDPTVNYAGKRTIFLSEGILGGVTFFVNSGTIHTAGLSGTTIWNNQADMSIEFYYGGSGLSIFARPNGTWTLEN